MRLWTMGAGRWVSLALFVLVWPLCGLLAAQTPLKPDDFKNIDEAIKVLEAKSAFLQTEASVPEDVRKKFDLAIKALRALYKLDPQNEKIEDSRFLAQGLGKGGEGLTYGLTPLLDDKGNPLPEAKGEEHRIAITSDLNVSNAKDCSKEFVRLLLILAHEAHHLNQTTAIFPKDDKERAKQIATPAGAAAVLDKKKKQFENEFDCYNGQNVMAQQLVNALTQIQVNRGKGLDPMTGVPEWARHWAVCTDDEALKKANEMADGLGKAVAAFNTMRTDVKGIPPATPGFIIVRYMDTVQVFRDLVGGANNVRVGLRYDDSHLEISDAEHGVVLLDTGIPHPQDFAFVQDQTQTGTFKLIVCGAGGITRSEGIVRVFDVPDLPPLGTRNGFEPTVLNFGTVPCQTLCAANPFLMNPTSILMMPTGQAYVWDVDAAALYRMPDDDHDGVPDRVDLSASSVNVPRGFDLRELATVSVRDGHVILNWRIGVPLDAGDSWMYEFLDPDANGTFQAVRPTRPSILLRSPHPR